MVRVVTGTREWCRYRLMKGVTAIVVIGVALIYQQIIRIGLVELSLKCNNIAM
ncbi:hypothetical protein ATG70_0538 [Bacillus sp. es.036]|nr:hypothetical protein ATG70_0538 [Bacillus sp. es.036]